MIDFACNLFPGSNANGDAVFVLVEQYLSWDEAQSHCRENYVDLASVRNSAENQRINTLAAGSEVWIGLRKPDDRWSDGTPIDFLFWDENEPDSIGDQQCFASNFGNGGKWSDKPCHRVLASVCYSVPNPGNLTAAEQTESSITVQWTEVHSSMTYILRLDGTEVNINASEVSHTISNLTAGTPYTFTVFTVYLNATSSGVKLTAATVPLNPEGLRPAGQDETSITLQWNQVNISDSYVL
uniref:C-type lectin domain-containing protein n=1 Tax=Myripristis murdjan TaxID=586833 RepID=A0A667YF61_9TELE